MTLQSPTLNDFQGPFTAETWAILDSYLGHLPERVRLVVWASEKNSCTEENGVDLAHTLAERFPQTLEFKHRPRLPNYDFYPVTAVMGLDLQGKEVDYGIRFIGLPAWHHINTLIGAIQAVAFRASTLEAKTRIQLNRLMGDKTAAVQLFTTPEDEEGVLMGTLLANLAVFSPAIRLWVVMQNDFPELAHKYSIYTLPHTIINERHHLQGVYDETQIVAQLVRIINE